ncbi:MAG: hypothetical protein UX87_C0007G0033 [Candidatus Amesbacteria bacterium GW2011_GWA1_47_16]|uniref:RNA polymerase sigma factor n=4 Tax=Candidatus Amesiibacteriota TaxID=1752730 RepID=A0A0G1S4G9_9BACT|nr:MAG: hypothetical protein UX86_C0010G0022 [Candidatus Amesbacteria bacterium GW2011_GWC1_47_15]KKU64525.1 MAG: hypothetical protein UX87_C0007G0033 [Candidatus Amesbacteria bacterium GW2011_GWA1_47_16]KKU98069.1 MAG: hypothetical protein UY28_C0008G0015 [Candidatus Amesbacteria bacterium GW2011_GWB1_48_13]OGC98832.1 MAG: hypothetical protein A2701_02590 [Candidatus Amesbacteria bacterium RIFCSPHIGHO2_01_FULL_47_34]OGD01058.1 MAG: hypothetical protein A2972_03040 [Candidatus Amesbacteria bact
MPGTTHPVALLYRLLGRKVLRLLLKRSGGDLEAAETVLQDTFIAAYKSFHTFHSKSTYFTWICSIALNKLTDYYRQQVNEKSKFFVPAMEQFNQFLDPRLTPEEKLITDEFRAEVNNCLDLLPSEYRRLLHLKYYQELSVREICLRLNLSPRQLEGRLYRARRQLAAVIARRSPHLKNK